MNTITEQLASIVRLASRQAIIAAGSARSLESLFDDLAEQNAPGGFVALLLASQHLDRSSRVLYAIVDGAERIQKDLERHTALADWEPRFTRAAEQLQAQLDIRIDAAAENADPWEGTR